METHCPCCSQPDSKTCSCRNAIARYLQLLIEADESVSTHKVTSEIVYGTGCIDKLCLRLETPLHVDEVQQRISKGGMKVKKTKLRDRRWHLEFIQMPGTYLHLGHIQGTLISKIVTRPSAFTTFDQYAKALGEILTQHEISTSTITRLDLAVDYSMNFQTFIRGLNISHKSAKIMFSESSKGSHSTGITLGKGSEKIVIYDKARDLGIKEPLSRIELQLSREKLPTRRVYDLPRVIKDLSFSPFKNVKVGNIEFKNNYEILDQKQLHRLIRLKEQVESHGFLSARKTLNADGNFARNYSQLFTFKPSREQPNTTLINTLNSFLSTSPTDQSI